MLSIINIPILIILKMKVIKRYISAHINDGDYTVRNDNCDIQHVSDDQSVLTLMMYDNDYNTSININKWNKIVVRIGGDQFNYNEGDWQILSLLKIGTLHSIPSGGVYLVLKVSKDTVSLDEKGRLLKELI